MSTEEEEREVEKHLAMRETLSQVQYLVNGLHAFHSARGNDIGSLWLELPRDLRSSIRGFLSREGLNRLPSQERQDARRRILSAVGLCLENARYVEFIDGRLVGAGELSSSDLEALYRRMLESSTALEILVVDIPANESEQWESDTCRLVADIITRAKSLHSILIRNVPLTGQSAVAKAVAAGQDPHLQQLYVRLELPKDEALAGLLGEAIASHQSLSTVDITVVDGEKTSVSSMDGRLNSVGLLLSNAFLDQPSNTSINSLIVDWTFVSRTHKQTLAQQHEIIRDDLPVLSQILQTASNLTQLELKGLWRIQSGDLLEFFKNIRDHGVPYLQSLSLELKMIDVSYFAMLVELFKSQSMRALKNVSLNIQDRNGQELDWTDFFASLTIRQLESVSLRGQTGHAGATKAIEEWICSCSKTLQKLEVCLEDLDWRSIFSCLKENRCLKSLTVLDNAVKDDDAYKELLEVLQVNPTLQEVNWSDTSGNRIYGGSSRSAAVQEALKAKARQESYLAELRKGLGQAEWQSPKCGRVFLCGSPEAGKTQLTHTMCEVANVKSSMKILKRLKEKLLRRTEGVEIHMLRNKEDMQILLWDLAGQNIFRALQECLFPRVSRASLFIFVFSPFERSFKESRTKGSNKKKPELKLQLRETFEKEFLEWLRFIISNSAVTGFNLPQLMVVISHQDWCKSMEFLVNLQWIEIVLDRFIMDFEDVIHIHPTPFFIDGHEPNDVKPIVDEVLSFFHNLFQKKLSKVPSACYNLSQHLVRWTSENPTKPILDDQAFFELCGAVPDLQPFSKKCQKHDVESMKLLKAVGSYLHDVGAVINMMSEEKIEEQRGQSRCNLIVVNPNWLTHEFLGRFIGFEQGFQLTREEEDEWAKRCVDGFMSETDFETLLPKRLKSSMKQFSKVTLETVRDLMENLDLLYVIPVVDQGGQLTDSRLFIPTFFKQKSEESLKWQAGVSGDCFLGVRLCCKDSKRTYLSPSFFSRFQVMIWRKFMEDEEMKSSKPVINCKFNLIFILVDSFQILIESGGEEFIDVLIQSPKSRERVWTYVEECIVKMIRDFCASSRGCPGVNLVMHIIRTECVKRLTLCKHRKSQSVAREDLKKNLLMSVQKVGLGSKTIDLHWHTWHSVQDAELTVGSENVVDLLPPNDVHDVYTWVKSKTQVEVDTLEKTRAKLDTLKEVMKEVDNDLQELHSGECKMLQKVEKKVVKSPSLRRHEDLKRTIEKGFEEMRAELGSMRTELEKLRHEIKEINLFLRKETEKFYRKLDQLMGQTMFMRGWPKRPYFTSKDVSFCHKITAMVDIGKPLMLHFECEGRDGHHIVPKQPGYEIIVGEENREALRQITNISVRAILYLMKAGLHIFVGMGDLVPELETSDGNITVLTSSPVASLLRRVPVQDGRTSNQPTTPCSPEEAWIYLQDILESNLRDRIPAVFWLHQVEYFDKESSCACTAWLCQGCLEAGLKEKKLKKL